MSTMTERSMMWRTTYAFGALCFGLLLAYVGFLFGGDGSHGVAYRVFAASPLLLGAIACLISAAREVRGSSPGRRRRRRRQR